MKPPIVDDIMKKPVYYVNATDKVEKAIQEMEEKGIKKILVKDGEKPIGVLEFWMITKSDHQRLVNQMDLRPFGRAPLGTLLTDIKKEIMDFPAVYIHNPDDLNELKGVVTTYDLVRAF